MFIISYQLESLLFRAADQPSKFEQSISWSHVNFEPAAQPHEDGTADHLELINWGHVFA